MIIKEYGIRSVKYVMKYPKHYAGYAVFGVCYYNIAKYYRNSKNEILRMGFAGSIAQFVTEIIFHPIDVINTRTKAEIFQKDMNSYKMVRRILSKEGMYGFWRGASSTYYGALLGGMIYFSAYKYLKNFFTHQENHSNGKIHTLAYLTSSLMGEFLFMLFYYPYDLIRTRVQTRTVGYEYKGPIDGIRRILDGDIRNFRKLYVGATPSFVLNLSNQTIMFTVLESMREYFLTKQHLTSINQLPTFHYLLCSVAAGAISGAATNIMEVVTIHKQVNPKFKFVLFLEEQGVRALTQGLFARVIINVFHSVTLFFIVDEISAIFNVEL